MFTVNIKLLPKENTSMSLSRYTCQPVHTAFSANIVYAHRHCAASVQAVDGSLSFCVSLEFNKCTTFKKESQVSSCGFVK